MTARWFLLATGTLVTALLLCAGTLHAEEDCCGGSGDHDHDSAGKDVPLGSMGASGSEHEHDHGDDDEYDEAIRDQIRNEDATRSREDAQDRLRDRMGNSDRDLYPGDAIRERDTDAESNAIDRLGDLIQTDPQSLTQDQPTTPQSIPVPIQTTTLPDGRVLIETTRSDGTRVIVTKGPDGKVISVEPIPAFAPGQPTGRASLPEVDVPPGEPSAEDDPSPPTESAGATPETTTAGGPETTDPDPTGDSDPDADPDPDPDTDPERIEDPPGAEPIETADTADEPATEPTPPTTATALPDSPEVEPADPPTETAAPTPAPAPPAPVASTQPEEPGTRDDKTMPPGIQRDVITLDDGEVIEIYSIPRWSERSGRLDVGTDQMLIEKWRGELQRAKDDYNGLWWLNRIGNGSARAAVFLGEIYVGVIAGPYAAVGTATGKGGIEEAGMRRSVEGYAEKADRKARWFSGDVMGPVGAALEEGAWSATFEGGARVLGAGSRLATGTLTEAQAARRLAEEEAEIALRGARSARSAERIAATRALNRVDEVQRIRNALPNMTYAERQAAAEFLGTGSDGAMAIRQMADRELRELSTEAGRRAASDTYSDAVSAAGRRYDAERARIASETAGRADEIERGLRSAREASGSDIVRQTAQQAAEDGTQETVNTIDEELERMERARSVSSSPTTN